MSRTEIQSGVCIRAGLETKHRAAAASGYWNAFQRKLHYPLGPAAKAQAFIERVMDPDHAISAVSEAGNFLGVAGFQTARGAFVGGTYGDLQAVYGWSAAPLRALAASMLERDLSDGILLMDGIFVQPAARGRGVGTALLRAIIQRAEEEGCRHVRLDVIDTNPRARALYEREGFKAEAVRRLGPLRYVFGFSSATEMVRRI